MGRLRLVIIIVIAIFALQGCFSFVSSVAQYGGAKFGLGKAKEWIVGSATVEDELPQVADQCNEVNAGVWSCLDDTTGNGDMFVILKKGEGKSLENSQHARKLVGWVEEDLGPGKRIARNHPLTASPVFQEKMMEGSTLPGAGLNRISDKFTGRWLVIEDS